MEKNLKPGINHIEFWVSDLSRSVQFYNSFLNLVGWQQISDRSFSDGSIVIYFLEVKDVGKTKSLGMRHLCFNAAEKQHVDRVYKTLVLANAEVIRGPVLMPYSKEYYTVDFYDPDGQVLEVAHTPFANSN